MKTTSYITVIAACAVLVTPLTAEARSHRHRTGAALTGLAVGLGIGLLSSANAQAQPIYRYETTQVVISQPVPGYYAPPPVYVPPVYHTHQVIIRPSRPVIHSWPRHYRSSHHGRRGAPYYHRRPSYRGRHTAPPRRPHQRRHR